MAVPERCHACAKPDGSSSPRSSDCGEREDAEARGLVKAAQRAVGAPSPRRPREMPHRWSRDRRSVVAGQAAPSRGARRLRCPSAQSRPDSGTTKPSRQAGRGSDQRLPRPPPRGTSQAIGRSADEVSRRCIVDAAMKHLGADVSRSHAPHRGCALFCLCADAALREYCAGAGLDSAFPHNQGC